MIISIEVRVRVQPPQTINKAVAMLAALTGITRSPTQVRLFLKRLSLQHRNTPCVPCSHSAFGLSKKLNL
jgi:hypothetical protein